MRKARLKPKEEKAIFKPKLLKPLLKKGKAPSKKASKC
jgi:hypothetical protein